MRGLVKYAPELFNPFVTDDGIDRFFDSVFGKGEHHVDDSWAPAADIIEDDEKYTISAELPGIKQEDVNITLNDNVLTLKGEKKKEKEAKDKYSHRIERSFGSFTRSFRLPREVQADNIGAVYKDGVLEIAVPKSEKAKPKEIEIKVR